LRCIGSSASVSGEGGERNGSGVEVKEERRRRRRREKRREEGKKAKQMPSHLGPPRDSSSVAVTAGSGLGGDTICAVAAHMANGHG
jgi:hypothetical protein